MLIFDIINLQATRSLTLLLKKRTKKVRIAFKVIVTRTPFYPNF